MSQKIIRDSFFQLGIGAGYAGSVSGLYEGTRAIVSHEEGLYERDHGDVITTIDRSASLPLPDFLFTMTARCVSERTLALFRENGMHLSPAIKWVPVRAVRKTGKTIGKYWWPKCESALDVFDYQNSKYTVIPPEGFVRPPPPGVIVYDKVTDWVLRGDMIGSLDFFYGCRVRWYASPRLKALIEKSSLSGFHFTPVAISVA